MPAARSVAVPAAPSVAVPAAPSVAVAARSVAVPAAPAPVARVPRAAVAAVAPKAAVEPHKPRGDEPEAVSLREIETLLSPGKVPPRLPGAAPPPRVVPAPRPPLETAPGIGPAVERFVPAELPGPPRARLDSADDHDPVPPSSRWGESRTSDLTAMAALVPAPRPAAPRGRPVPLEVTPTTAPPPKPSPLESTAADLELMAALAPAPPKKAPQPSPPTRPAWAPAKAPLQARGPVVAVLSSEATAALKGVRPAPGAQGPAAGTGAWRAPAAPPARAHAVTTGSHAAPHAAPNPGVLRAPTMRSPGAAAERPPAFVPSPPGARASAARPASDEVDDAGWETEADAAAAPAPAQGAAQGGFDPVAMGALQMRMGPRASLPDPDELLRDSTGPGRSTGRGSVVDPLELYGATPAKPAVPEQSLPKVMVQAPKPVPAAAAKTADALAEAEARAAAASAEANAAFRPKVDLPARAEPRPFPKPPPRRPSPSRPDAAQQPPPDAKPAAPAPGTPRESRPDDTLLTGQKPATPAAAAPEPKRAPPPPPARAAVKPALPRDALGDAEPVSAEPASSEPLSVEPDDEIPIDLTPDAGDATTTEGSSNPSSGRFDLQQLMAGGPTSAKSTKKGLGDEDLFSIANDLFTEPKLAPPDLSALGKAGAPPPPPGSGRLLAPVAVGAAPDAAPPKARTAAPKPVLAVPDLAAASLADVPRPRSRALTPWVLLPVIALAVAAFLVWRGRSPEPAKDLTTDVTAQQGQRDPVPTVTQQAPPATTGESPPSSTASSPAQEPPSSNDTPPAGTTPAWKPPSTATAPVGTAPTTPTTPTTPPVATSATTPPAPTPTQTTPPPSGAEFNQAAAKAALRSAAASAAACPSEKPGVAQVSITFAPSGRVTSSKVSGTFAGTTTGGCIASAMRAASVPPFEGGPISTSWQVTIR